MHASIAGAVIACAAGAALAALNDVLTRRVLQGKPALLSAFFVVRQILNVGLLAALFFLSPVFGWEVAPVLIGGALGVTVPSVLFALRLARRTNTAAETERTESPDTDAAEGKERGQNG